MRERVDEREGEVHSGNKNWNTAGNSRSCLRNEGHAEKTWLVQVSFLVMQS